MNRALKDEIAKECGYRCFICETFAPKGIGSPHHITKVSEEPLLENCKKNIGWTCPVCHGKTESLPGFNKKLKKQLQEQYRLILNMSKHYSVKEIAEILHMPKDDVEKAMIKGRLVWSFVDGIPKALGENLLRFLMGGKLLL